MPDLPLGDAILTDLSSQALCLKDALAAGGDRVVLHAFEAVTRARGLTQLAADAGLERGRLIDILDTSVTLGTSALKSVIADLIQRWEAVVQDAPAENCEELAPNAMRRDVGAAPTNAVAAQRPKPTSNENRKQ